MPTLPLPPLTTGVPLDAGDLPVSSLDDVQGTYSQDVQALEVAPVRDAIQCGQYYSLLAYQDASRYAAAQSDPLRATGEYIDTIGGERGVFRSGQEADLSYRTRVNAVRTVVDPVDVIAAANAALASVTAISCRYAERSDGWFLATDPSATFSSHLFAEPSPGMPSVAKTSGSLSAYRTPGYPDRDYSSLTLRRPPGVMLNADSYGRWFLLRAPDVGAVDGNLANVCTVAPSDNSGLFLFTGDGTGSYLFNFTTTAAALYQALIDAVEAVRGQSIRWQLLVDPNLDS